MVDFKALMAERKANSQASFQSRVDAAAKTNSFEKKEDDRFWQPETDKAGNGYAVIRFLDAPAGEDIPWVRIWNHGFKGPGGQWYIENSLTTLNLPDPVAEYNSELWNSGVEANKEIVRKQKRKLTYISNILVITDSKHPENEGKVFLFRYGKKIYDKIKDVMSPPPEFADETPMDPFNFWTGANFKLKIRMVEGYRNYDKSEFDKTTIGPIGTDEEIEEIFGKLHSLKAFLDPSNFKSYDELKKNLQRVLSASPSTAGKKAGDTPPETTEEDIDYEAEAAKAKPKATPKPVAKTEKATVSADSDDDDLDYFTNLAKGEDDPSKPF